MLDRLKSLFSPPNKEEEPMAATSQKKQTQQTQHMGKSFDTTCPVEQLSAASECETEGQCEIESESPQSPCEDSVREKAYLLWEAAGRPEGDGVDFWLQAEQA